MPSAKVSAPDKRKRPLSEPEPETETLLQPPAKQQKLEEHQRHRTPSSIWDNLSRQWLTRRALREFDRRTVWPAVPVPPHRTGKEIINLEKLKRFARHGGAKLGDIRGGSKKRAKTGKELDTSCTPRKSSAYDRNFQQHLIDHGVYPHGYDNDSDDDGSVYPKNWDEIHERLVQPRPSLSPSRFTREEFRTFEKKNTQALTESKVKAFPIIAGTVDISSQENLVFGNLEDLTDGSKTKAQPDIYDGVRPEKLNKRIRQDLGPYIVPSTNTAVPCLPNFFVEGKGPDGSAPVSKLQAMYDRALGARGIHELRSYVDPETAYDNNAYAITSTYHGGSGALKLYTTHRTPSTNPNHDYEYRMTQLRVWDMTDNPDTFRQGAGALRNARDWAKEKREELVTAANGKTLNGDHSALGSSTQSLASLSSDDPAHLESETSADELGLNNGGITHPAHRTLAGARTNPLPKGLSERRSKKTLNSVKGMK